MPTASLMEFAVDQHTISLTRMHVAALYDIHGSAVHARDAMHLKDKSSRSLVAFVCALAALAGFITLARIVAVRPPGALDLGIERWLATHPSPPLHGFFLAVSRIAGITGMRVLGFGGAIYLWIRSRRRLAVGMVVVVLAGMEFFEIAKRYVARQRPAYGFSVDPTYAFPSGHATLSAAVCGTLAYVFWREGLASGGAMLVAAIVAPLVIGFSRVYLDMHWATDVLGGWLAGLAIACSAAALYELTKSPS